MVAGGLAILAARVSLQFIHPIPTWLAFVAPGVALVGMALLLVGLRARYAIDRWLAPAVVLGLELDTARRALWHTWDLKWQDGTAATLWTAAVGAADLVALWILAHRPGVSEDPDPAVSGILSALGLQSTAFWFAWSEFYPRTTLARLPENLVPPATP